MKLQNVIYCGDNLTWMKQMPDGFIDLCYIDPPFFSNKHYEVIFNDGEEIRSFEDRWKGNIYHYIEWMKVRIFEIHRLLKDAGSFYLHCDWHAGHYLKVMCDEIFGINNFQNDIIWRYRRWPSKQKGFQRMHDNILRYSKGKSLIWNQLYEKLSSSSLKQWKGKKRIDVVSPEGKRHSITAEEKSPGVPMSDVWEISQLSGPWKEYLGYPTQKPEALMERIIKASSKEGDLVFDPFCGCGTTLVVAQRLKRNWLGIDVSPTACKLMKRRLAKVGVVGVEIFGLPLDINELKALKPFEFQNWVIGTLGGTVSDKKSADMGIDGYSFMERDPIQVKQQEHVGRIEVDKFETALRRVGKSKGIMVAFSYTKGAYEEVARAKDHNGLEITLMSVAQVRQQLL